MDWYLDILKNHYADFDGRARRQEFWMFTLVNFGVYLAIAFLARILPGILGALVGLVYVVFALGVLVPSVALTIRRLHDTGRTGWLALLGLIPLANLVLLYFLILEGDTGPNEYGPDPKAGVADYSGSLGGDLG